MFKEEPDRSKTTVAAGKCAEVPIIFWGISVIKKCSCKLELG